MTKYLTASLLALTVASPAMAQLQPGPNIINGRPVTIGSNGRPLQHYVGPCAYGPAIVGLIETAASRLDPRSFPEAWCTMAPCILPRP
jgi:hypothetical protein